MPKFTVRTVAVVGGFSLEVENRAGRAWVCNTIENCHGNAGEAAMVTEEWLNSGGTLSYPKNWTEVRTSRKAA